MTHTPKTARRKRRVATVTVTVIVVLVLAVAGVWLTQGERIMQKLGLGSNDYPGPGHGEVAVRVAAGDIGSDIAVNLQKKDVIKDAQPFIQYLTKHSDITFQTGTYSLKKQMSVKQAIAALRDPKNRKSVTVVIPEGWTLKPTLARLSKQTGVPLSEFEKLAKQPQALGAPEGFKTLEGFLFPATYTFDAGVDAKTVLTTMVQRMHQALNDHGVPVEDAHRVLTLASIVQREGGQNTDEYGKIARVFVNRLDEGMLLQSDATVAYGTGNYDTVWTTDAERADQNNLYNTYAHKGLPPGPIGMPGDVAIEAAVHPTPGDWRYFVTVNLKTGETRFGTTPEEHHANVELLDQWCRQHHKEGGKLCD